MQLPAGTVTFLFTDIHDSTRLWERHPDRMVTTIERHDALLRACVDRNGGFVVKSTGDGLMVVFADATQAVAAAIDAQVAIIAEPWAVPIAVRMGLHTGTARAVDGDYHAPSVNRAARVAAAAHPGQILATGATVAVAEGHRFRDLGEHRLKGLSPMRLLQVESAGLPHDFPPPVSLSPLVQIPSPLTRFVGRAAEIDALGALVAEHVVVTLTGIGGCGKTRLAVEVARALAPRFVDGVCFVDLTALADETRVAESVAAALGLVDDPAVDPLERLAAYSATRSVLIVLDNCEHLLDACADVAEAIGAASRTSRLLITSREPLGVIGEQVHAVRSLDLETEAVELFADRARQVREQFVVDNATRPAVVEICRRLDGIPLAVELAAAQVGHLSVAHIRDRLNDRFRLLVGGRRRVQRQQTLAAALDWSHDSLSPTEQRVFRRLAAFPAAFTLEAAEAVTREANVHECLASLVTKSLVDAIDDGEHLRYRLLETVRMYAQERLVAAGESDPTRDAHREWLVVWLESMPLERRWFGDADVLGFELHNVRAALEWSLLRGEVEHFVRIASGVDWARGGELRAEGRAWCEQVADSALPTDLRQQLLTMLTVLAVTSFDPRARSIAERVLSTCEDTSSPFVSVAVGWIAAIEAVRAASAGDASRAAAAKETAERAVSTSDAHAVPWRTYSRFLAGMTYATLSTALLDEGRRAEAHFRDVLAISSIGEGYSALRATAYEYLSLYRLLAGDVAEAVALAQQAPSGDGRWPMFGQNHSAARFLALAAGGERDAAQREFEQLAETFRRFDVTNGRETVCLYGGAVAAIDGDWERAARLLAAGRGGVRAGAEAGLVYFHYRDAVRAALGPDRARELRDVGMAMTIDDAIELALR